MKFMAIALAALMLAGCGGKKQESPTTATAVDSQTPVIKMTAKKFEFDPSEIRVKQGAHVTIEITSTDVEHGFSLPDYNIKVDLPPNETVKVEFDANKAGAFPFHCSVPCGLGHSKMKGNLIVEPKQP